MDSKTLEEVREENETIAKQWRGEFEAESFDSLVGAMESAGWRMQQVNPLVPGRFTAIYWATESNCVLPLANRVRQKWVQRFNQPGKSDELLECKNWAVEG